MRHGVRQVLSIVAITAIALHTALWGVAPVHVFGFGCRSILGHLP